MDAVIYAQEDEDVSLIYRREGAKRGSSGKTVEAVTSYGLGLSYIINDRFDFVIESTIRNVWNDRLDAWESPGSNNDKYSYTAVGFTYHLKKRKEITKFTNNQPNILANEVEVEKMQEVEIAKDEEEVAEKVIPVVIEKKEEEIVVVEKPIVEKEVAKKLKVGDFKEDVIRFSLNSSKSSAALNKQVKSIAEKLKNSPTTNITLGGYTDKSGSPAFNKTLSIQRAKWVKDELVRKYNISSDRISVIGHGESGTTLEFDPNNRKVEVIEVR